MCSKWPSRSATTRSQASPAATAAACSSRLNDDRHRVVARSVDEQGRHAERQALRGRGGGVALGHLVRPAAEELDGRAVAQAEAGGLRQIGHRRLADRAL